jgi:hypothetical protein
MHLAAVSFLERGEAGLFFGISTLASRIRSA